MTPRFRQIATALLLIFGVQIWLVVGRGEWGSTLQLKLCLAACGFALIPQLRRPGARFLDSLRQPAPRAKAITAAIIFLVSCGYLPFTAARQHRNFYPETHDQRMYTLQARMLAHGRLWMPQHPAADSFETFYVLVKPKYAAAYFPGTALLYAPAVGLSLPAWLTPLLTTAAIASLLYVVITELLDGVAGLLGAVMLLSLSNFRYFSILPMSHSILMLLGLLLTWAWLRWRSSPSLKWAALIGLLAGWAAITRPIDSLCFAIPIGVAMLLDLRRHGAVTLIRTAAVAAVAAAPFITLQLIMNYGVTGSILTTPVHLYQADASPSFRYGFVSDDRPPGTKLAQKLALNERFVVPTTSQHRLENLWRTWATSKFYRIARATLPNMLLLILIPVGVLVLDRKRAALWLGWPLFIALYAPFAFLLYHYCIVPTPAILLSVLLGVAAIEKAWPRWREHVRVFLTAVILIFALISLPEANRLVSDDDFDAPATAFDRRLATMISSPAIVLYHYSDGEVPDDEPVYNDDVVWPDDAPIIRAHDLPPRQNQPLFDYYAKHQPDRRVYRVERRLIRQPGYQPEFLGTAKELADRYNPPRP